MLRPLHFAHARTDFLLGLRDKGMSWYSWALGVVKAIVGPATPWLLRKLAGIRFISPLHHAKVNTSKIQVEWKYRFLFGMKLTVCNVEGNQYWPNGTPIPDPTHRRLKKEVYLGAVKGKQYTVVIASVSDDFRPILQYYSQVHQTLKDYNKLDKWIPFTIFPHDMPPGFIELDRIVVTLV